MYEQIFIAISEFVAAHPFPIDLNSTAFFASFALLDNRTLKNHHLSEKAKKAGSRIMVKYFPSAKYARVTITKIDTDDIGRENFDPKDRVKKEKEKLVGNVTNEENLKRSARRSYQTVMDKSRLMGIDRMLTLTFQDNVGDINEANKALKIFLALMRKRFGNFDYLAVPERQKRGAIHYHFGLNKFFHWTAVMACWKLAIKKAGFVQTGGIFINKTACTGSVNRMARYIAKYILKGVDNAKTRNNNDAIVGSGSKRYYSSKSDSKVIKVKTYTTIVRTCSDGLHHIKLGVLDILRDLAISAKTSFKKIEQISEFEFKNWMFQDSHKFEYEFV